jgi:tetratricopeptide (TPR) repeat protein
MAPRVHLMPSALRKLADQELRAPVVKDSIEGSGAAMDQGLHALVVNELGKAFPLATTVSVYDVLHGYNAEPRKKLILAVETQSPSERESRSSFETYVVKLGLRCEVARDHRSWEDYIEGQQVSKRIFVPVCLRDVGDSERAAAVYQDARQWYGLLTPNEEVATLAWAVNKAVFTGEVDVTSVERVIRQVCSDLGRSFYRKAEEDTPTAGAFYRRKLKLDDLKHEPVVHRWRKDEPWLMRRDVDWLLCGPLSPATATVPVYVDPYDYIVWALGKDCLPPTLVGTSHGDCHAGNVIVGMSGAEVEFPLLIDYGDMGDANAIVWDFVKLETELKVRLVAELYKNRQAREDIWRRVRNAHFHRLVQRWTSCDPSGLDPTVDRTQQIVFAFEFERLLQESMMQIDRSPRRLEGDSPVSQVPLERALSILRTVRSQAAEQLGRAGARSQFWQDELNFGLAVYGLNTIKFSNDAYPLFQRLFALVSAGTALARVTSIRERLGKEVESLPSQLCDWPIYHEPLRYAYRQWRGNNRVEEAEKLLESVSERFDYSVPFRRERALLQAKLGKVDAAQENLQGIVASRDAHCRPEVHGEVDLATLCEKFLEIEVLSRLGRIFKDKADASWEQIGIDFRELRNHTVVQYYRSASSFYRRAFDLSRDYYPGGNAAVTALLAGERTAAESLALEVGNECRPINLGSLPAIDRYWVLATEGDMSLILRAGAEAAGFYRDALNELPVGNDGMVQTTYHQLCRLFRALGENQLRPVLDVISQTQKFKLQKGPLGDCGGLFGGRSG